MKSKALKVLKKTDQVSMEFGEWFDKIGGNTYYDILIYVNDNRYKIPYQYGYNHGDQQAIDEGLKDIGYRVRNVKNDRFKSYQWIHVTVRDKLKRDLYK